MSAAAADTRGSWSPTTTAYCVRSPAAMLENAGFAVANGRGRRCRGRRLRARACPTSSLLDVEMPEGNGYQACANIRALPGGRDVPIVMVTGFDDTRFHRSRLRGGRHRLRGEARQLGAARPPHPLRAARRAHHRSLRIRSRRTRRCCGRFPTASFSSTPGARSSHCFSPLPALTEPQGRAAAPPHLSELLPREALARAMESARRHAARRAGVARILAPGAAGGEPALRVPLSAERHRTGARDRARHQSAQGDPGTYPQAGVFRRAHGAAQPRVDRRLPLAVARRVPRPGAGAGAAVRGPRSVQAHQRHAGSRDRGCAPQAGRRAPERSARAVRRPGAAGAGRGR